MTALKTRMLKIIKRDKSYLKNTLCMLVSNWQEFIFTFWKKSKKSNLHARNEMKSTQQITISWRIIFGYRNKHKFIQDFPYDNWSRKLLHLNDQKMITEIETATKIIIPDTHILMYNQDYAHQGSSIGQLFKRFWLLTKEYPRWC